MAIDDQVIEVDGKLWRITIDKTIVGVSNKPEIQRVAKEYGPISNLIPAPVNVVLPATLILDIWELL